MFLVLKSNHARWDKLDKITIILKVFCFIFIVLAIIDLKIMLTHHRGEDLKKLFVIRRKGIIFCIVISLQNTSFSQLKTVEMNQLWVGAPPSFIINTIKKDVKSRDSTISLHSEFKNLNRRYKDAVLWIILYVIILSFFWGLFLFIIIAKKQKVFSSIVTQTINQLLEEKNNKKLDKKNVSTNGLFLLTNKK